MTLQDELAIIRRQRHEAIVDAIKSTDKPYAVIAKEHGMSEATVKIIAREHRVRRQADKIMDTNNTKDGE